ncbi:hypothetical protein J2S43_005374 [Catenuloplanes nepalensis]|uniref:Alginate lyase domain-containing protein n=1 Tax=Catenuloplanes nepalensis TaxID=587533 RepID=A0ABT9MZJ1_9ACTN|nr:alginate lyase family protein [Catenuloplanes nepalensis]MDP9796862.1 hypothetical protein [Catenuloplanes nepalensis]
MKITRTRVAAFGVVVVLAVFAAVAAIRWPEEQPVAEVVREPAVLAAPADGAFRHPGVLVGADDLGLVKERVAEGAEPWASAFAQMKGTRYGDADWQPDPRAVVECGPYSNPDLGCVDEAEDGVAAYTQALLWNLTGEEKHALAAIRIIDAWAGVLERHTNVNGPLQAAWSAVPMVRAAELIRYSYGGWDPAPAEAMFRDVYLPEVIDGATWTNGNWELIMMEAATGIAVFLDDRATWDRAVERFRGRIKAYIYLESDGTLPVAPPGETNVPEERLISYWHGQRDLRDGVTQETCRDFGHAGWGLSAASHVAETARLQGLDLWSEIAPRMTAALNLHMPYALGEKAPSWLCDGEPDTESYAPLPEAARHHLVDRLGLALPSTTAYVQRYRPAEAAYFFAWETVTHGG